MPANKALKAIQLKKMVEFVLEVRAPLPLGDMPEQRDDSAAANNSLGADNIDDITDDMTAGSGGDDTRPSYRQGRDESSFYGGPEKVGQ